MRVRAKAACAFPVAVETRFIHTRNIIVQSKENTVSFKNEPSDLHKYSLNIRNTKSQI